MSAEFPLVPPPPPPPPVPVYRTGPVPVPVPPGMGPVSGPVPVPLPLALPLAAFPAAGGNGAGGPQGTGAGGSQTGGADEPPMIDFAALWQTVKRRWYVPFLTGSLLAGAAGFYLWRAPLYYTAAAELAVDQQKTSFLPGDSFKPEDLKSLEVLKSIEREITGQGLLLRVAEHHRLREDPSFSPPRKDGRPSGDDELVELLRKRVKATLERGTRHIVVTVDDTDPRRARDLCGTILTEATRQSTEATSETAQLARRSLTEEKTRAMEKVTEAQEAVDRFRQRFPSLPLSEQQSEMKTNVVEDALRAAGTGATSAQAETARLETIVRQIDAAKGRIGDLLRLPDIGQREEVASLKRSLGAKQAAFSVIDAEYGPKHPRHQQAVKEISETGTQLAGAVELAVSTVRNRLERARQDAAGFAAELEKRKRDSIEFAKVSGEFATLVSNLKAQRANYDRVLGRLTDAEVNSGLGGSILRIVDAPLMPTHPSKPRRKLMTAAGGVLGFGAGMGLVLLLHFMDRSLRSIQAGENALRLPGLAALPEDRAAAGSLKAGLLHDRPEAGLQAEAFRSLRTALGILGRGAAARSYLFTATRPGEGTSYTAMNFALSLAQQGYRTLLIDANLRNPALDPVFLASRPATGLADHLSGNGVHDASACQRTAVPGLYVFAAGTAARHPGEILNEHAFAALLQDAVRWFHKVVIDTPPVGLVTDALPLARHVDTVCLVVRAASTPGAEARRAANKLAMAGARPVGFVLNAAPAEALRSGFVGDFAAGFRSLEPAQQALPGPGASMVATAPVPLSSGPVPVAVTAPVAPAAGSSATFSRTGPVPLTVVPPGIPPAAAAGGMGRSPGSAVFPGGGHPA